MISKELFIKKLTVLIITFVLVNGPSGILLDNAIGDGEGNYPAPENGDWIITQETTVINETIILNGDLIIESDATLYLINTTILFNCTYDGEFGVTVKSDVELQVEGHREILEGGRLGGDYDLFSGRDNGGVYLFKNNGSKSEPEWEDMVE